MDYWVCLNPCTCVDLQWWLGFMEKWEWGLNDALGLVANHLHRDRCIRILGFWGPVRIMVVTVEVGGHFPA